MSKASKALNAHRERPVAELTKLLSERKKELFDQRMSAFTDQERSPAQIRALRHDIARIETVLGQKAAVGEKSVSKEKEPVAR